MSQEHSTTQASENTITSHVRQIEDLSGPAGRLEALLNTGAPHAPFCAVVCHPYPPAGGTMHTKVVYHTAKVLSGLGIPVLRFNFRGVGLSVGDFDHGHGEQDDVRAALNWLDRTFHLPLLFAGFSFGSYVGLRACCSDTRVVGRIALGLPVRAAGRDYTYEFLNRCPGPLLSVSGNQDEFCPPATLRHIIGTDPARKVAFIPGADHFFQGTLESPRSKLPEMQAAVRHWLEEALSARIQATSK
jgi:alpha/beta superfamily hydrolase